MLRNIGFHSHKKKLQTSGIISKKITENNSIPLEEILSEDSVIDELENHNQILINYLNKEKVKQMLDYIIKEPPNDTSYNIGHKYPWVCSQLFNIENSEILKYLYTTNKELNKEENKMDVEYNKSNENKIELLDYLLNFLTSNSEPNYVLCGYFASLIKNLVNMKPALIIKYFYLENKNFIKKLIKYSYRESIAEILNKILQYDVTEEEFDISEMDLIRMEILEDLFNSIDINMENEKLESISILIKNLSTEENLFTDLLNNRKIVHNLITKPLRNINLLIKDKALEHKILNQRRNFVIIIDIIINWIQSINSLEIDLPSTTDESEEENINEDNNNLTHTLLSYELFGVLSNLIKINFNKNNDMINQESKILQCFDDKELIPLGLFRIKIVELLGNLFSYFKNIPNLYDKLLIDSNFFENALNYLFEYEFNNIYQEALLFLFKKYLNYSEFHPILSEYLFTKINIMDIIIAKIKSTEPNNDEKIKKDCFIYSSENTTNRGYISFLVSLAYKINTIIGGDPLRINDTLSREGSISFITRAQPFVAKEEIAKFYGMEENELYEQVSNESEGDKKNSKLNCAVKSMEKYLNDNWNEFFYEHISDKIKLYETKLLKDSNGDSAFRNPFILENDDEKVENRENNFGLGDDEDQDILKEKTNKPDFNKALYGDDDIDFNMGNRFKMSMRLPRNHNNNFNLTSGRKRSSAGDKTMPNKVLVDEIDDIDNNINEEKYEDNIEEKEENEEENPLDKFKKKNNEEDDNKEEEDDEDPFAKFQKKEDNRKISLISFRKKKKTELENEDKEELNDINDGKNNEEENEENPLDKFKQENNTETLNKNEEKMDLDNDDLYDDDENQDEDPFKNLNKENEENKNNIEDNKEDMVINNNDKENNLYEDDLYEDDEDNDNNNDNKEEEEEINPLDKFKEEKQNKEEEKKVYKDLVENPFDSVKKENNKPKDKKEEEEESEEEENLIDKLNRQNNNTKEENEENPLDKFKSDNKDKENEQDKKDNIDDLLYETKEEDDEEEEKEEDSEDNNNEDKDKK